MFEAMIRGIREEETVRRLFIVRVTRQQPVERKSVARNQAANVGGEPQKKKPVRKVKKPGRRRPLPLRQAQAQRLPMKLQGLLRPQRVKGAPMPVNRNDEYRAENAAGRPGVRYCERGFRRRLRLVRAALAPGR